MRSVVLLAWLMVCGWVADRATAADSTVVAATVGDDPITIGAAERERKRLTPELPAATTAAAILQATALQACIQRSLVLQELAAQKKAASDADVEQALARLKKQVAARETKFADYLAKIGLDETQLRNELRWGLTWDAYLKEQLTDANLERYYQKHAKDFDGTEIRVGHILWKTSASDDTATIDKLRATADAVRREIESGKLSFATAAQKHSQAPTAEAGGDIGWIERRRPMPEAFSQAAFALERNQVSAPVETPFGIHLITCLDSKPGKLAWQEVREELRSAMTRYLFDWLATRRAKDVKVTFSGQYPHRDPLSGQVILPR